MFIILCHVLICFFTVKFNHLWSRKQSFPRYELKLQKNKLFLFVGWWRVGMNPLKSEDVVDCAEQFSNIKHVLLKIHRRRRQRRRRRKITRESRDKNDVSSKPEVK